MRSTGTRAAATLRAAPARIAEEIDARGTDIYRTTPTSRDVFVLAAQLAPGDSGAPLVDQFGRVVGVAFAIDPGRDGTAYALTTAELRARAGRPRRPDRRNRLLPRRLNPPNPVLASVGHAPAGTC